jgi:hypothetical protein
MVGSGSGMFLGWVVLGSGWGTARSVGDRQPQTLTFQPAQKHPLQEGRPTGFALSSSRLIPKQRAPFLRPQFGRPVELERCIGNEKGDSMPNSRGASHSHICI